QASRFERLLKFFHRDVYLALLLGTCADQFAAGEHENHHFRLIHTVNEPGKLLRFVHGLLQTVNRLLQVNMASQTAGRNNVLDHDLWPSKDDYSISLQFVNHLEHRPPGLAFRLCASTDHFSRAEDQGRGLRLLQPVDQAWELFRAVLYSWKNPDDRVEVYPLVQRRGSDNVLDIDERLTLIRQEPQAPALA